MASGKKRADGAAGEGTRRWRKKDAASEPAGREDAARPGGMAMVDPWGALLAGLLVAEEPAAEADAGGEGERGGGRGRKGGRSPGPAGGR